MLVPQLVTSLKLTSGAATVAAALMAANCGVVLRAVPLFAAFKPQLAARAVSPTTTINTRGLLSCAQLGPALASSPTAFRTCAVALVSLANTLPSDHTKLAGVMR